MALQKVALVDFDGVVLRNKNILSRVANKATKFVQHKLDISSKQSASTINRYLYTTYGHTAIGLNKIDNTITLEDFNKFVYDDIHLNHTEYYEARKELHDWQSFMHQLTKKQIPVHIFTNAPKEWCMNFIDPHENLHWVWDHIPQSLEYLKPQMPVYDALSTQFKQKTVYFIDDSIGNLTNSRTWENILFIDKVPHSSIPHIYTAKDLKACADIICS